MNKRQQDFVENYLQTGNATESAIKAGYSERNARNRGSQLLKTEAVVNALRERSELITGKANIDTAEILAELRVISKTNNIWVRLRAYDMLLKATGGYISDFEVLRKMDDEDLDRLAIKMIEKMQNETGENKA